ncbi:MAG: IMP dehydrogenase [Spiroplasma poulsonii]|uniref:Inosine-5'-monophosphate dehydrogenase n=1 Tax=Spiroplasma poulsonii TaxID=2138 RepID=A0A2P6FGE2_9MOLU|nr:IMP dehydrogenase [Spiroplasma poulsonii]KAF0849825.1 Inosine-5'-monophosphate dehydrogenase [Spiroplasma poulsonii]MBW1242134.1 IMP dehydrogenase [Spiroplasma poulsonii]PQM32531.1 Inosine-5'-monophosphate dehydrogenase [Spiroplasma poulsonii]PWF95206.1 Inosine-5'-monophosphate dehydrogenase [Spiroplasma poulsonii]PWF97997.1 Inosine-5'-monophosphate dehydrogenase [Spiroplasma poulsonii]
MQIKKSYTFNDLLLVPQKSDILPYQIDLRTKITKNIELNIPFLSSAMDTVTESKLAIAIAREGGIGIIHKNLSIDEQAAEVEKVKRNESGFIINPITLKPTMTVQDAENIMAQYRISGLPIVDEENKLLGIITNRDIRACHDLSAPVADFMTVKNLITTHEKINLEQAKEILLNNRIEKLPIVNAKNILKGLITIKDINNRDEYPNACKDDQGRLRVGAAVGIDENTLLRVEKLVAAAVDVIVVDSAHGHSQGIITMVSKIKKAFPTLELIAGNVVTGAGALDLIAAGADAIKVGVGPGSICTTRIVAGVGVPQITAINDVYEVCAPKGVPIIADGGIKYSGDVVKALAAGGAAVMMGSVFAATLEAPGEEMIVEGKKYKTYMGMGSLTAMKKGSADRYFQDKNRKLVPEGVEGRVLLKGKLSDILFQFIGGLRSGFGYCGAKNIATLQKTAQFVEISNNGLKESHPHDIAITKEPPNYTK